MRSIQLIISILVLAYSSLNLKGQSTNDSVRVTYKGKGVTVRPQGDESKTTIQFKDTQTKKEIVVKVSFRDMDDDDNDLDSAIKKTLHIVSGSSEDGKRKHFIETHFLPNFDWGFASTNNEEDNSYAITPRFSKSTNLDIGIIKQDMNLYKNRLLFSYGFGFNNYYLKYNDRQKVQYLDKSGYLATYQDTITYTTNRLDVFYMTVPLMLEFHTKGDKFQIMAGVEYCFGGRSKTVTKGVVESQDFKHEDDKNIKINPTQLNAIVRIGSEHIGLYGRYSLSDLYQGSAYASNTNPHQHMFSVGICLLGI